MFYLRMDGKRIFIFILDKEDNRDDYTSFYICAMLNIWMNKEYRNQKIVAGESGIETGWFSWWDIKGWILQLTMFYKWSDLFHRVEL